MQEDKQPILHSKGGEIVKPGWWNLDVYPDHEYVRQSVEDIFEEKGFCGWPTLIWLVKVADMTQYRTDQADYLRGRDQALISALFETGGRLKEVLLLRKNNFEIKPDRILVRDMFLLKRYRKVRSWIERVKELPKASSRARLFKDYDEKRKCWYRKRWATEPVFTKRKPFTVWLAEPLSSILLEWIKQSDDYLFPPGRKSKKPHLEESRAYTIMRTVEKTFNRLVDEDVIALPKVRLFDHWFRGQRASQLHAEYGHGEFELKRFFTWESTKMAYLYCGIGVPQLEAGWTETEDMKKARGML